LGTFRPLHTGQFMPGALLKPLFGQSHNRNSTKFASVLNPLRFGRQATSGVLRAVVRVGVMIFYASVHEKDVHHRSFR
jgi:hypothetical protein